MFGQLVEATARQIETAQFPSQPGIRFAQNAYVSCAHLGLCLGNERLVGTKLNCQSGAALIGLTCLRTNGGLWWLGISIVGEPCLCY